MGHRLSRQTTGATPSFKPLAPGHGADVAAPSDVSLISRTGVAKMPDDLCPLDTEWLPTAMTSEAKASVLRGMLQLGIDLLRELRHTSPAQANVVLSPYGAASALEELLVGSRGNTAGQISAALHIPVGDRVSAYFDDCDRELPSRRRSDAARRFDMGYLNNVHHAQTLLAMDPMSQEGELLRLERFSWDFVNTAEESREEIDRYARLYANPFEPSEILPQGCITPSTLVCMVSVVDFRGSWKHAFDDRTATRALFHESDGRSSTVIMIHQTGRFRVAKCPDLQATAVELPYGTPGRERVTSASVSLSSLYSLASGSATPAIEWTGPEFSLVVLLPDDKNGLATLEAKLTALTALRCFSSLKQRGKVRVSLPLFKVKQVTEMVPVLSALGVRDVFTERAQLWGSSIGEKRVTLMRHAAAFETAQSGGRRLSHTKQRRGRLARLARSIGVLLKLKQWRTDVISVDRPFAFFVTCSRPDAVILLGSVRKISW